MKIPNSNEFFYKEYLLSLPEFVGDIAISRYIQAPIYLYKNSNSWFNHTFVSSCQRTDGEIMTKDQWNLWKKWNSFSLVQIPFVLTKLISKFIILEQSDLVTKEWFLTMSIVFCRTWTRDDVFFTRRIFTDSKLILLLK